MGWLCRPYTMATHKQSIDLIMISTENPPASLIRTRITQTAQDIPNIWNSAEETPPKTKHVPFRFIQPPHLHPNNQVTSIPTGPRCTGRGVLQQRKSVPLMNDLSLFFLLFFWGLLESWCFLFPIYHML